ncbi:MAG TPA: glucose-6-phosphate dehydrogenase [Candidatus Nitrosotenuis sp.]|nr:glucose-6-phosphate dehydrogenase [Candidatus Nitrosotenuis sp.]
MSKVTTPTILVIVGITGDLAKRMLLPAIEKIAHAGMLPDDFRMIGVSRRDVPVDEIVSNDQHFVREHLDMVHMDLESEASYRELSKQLDEISASFSAPAQRLFYLSVPPEVSSPIIEHLGNSGLADVENTKLLLEKPFGIDLESAHDLVAHIEKYFSEHMVYRIDHFMAKEMAQNIVVFRSGNSLFKRTWNKDFIKSIHIIASETLDIEGRTTLYEQTGALRDLVQSHLMQLAALTLMELPQVGQWQDIPAKRLKALRTVQPPKDLSTDVTRAQYEGYRSEVNNEQSTVETFASLTLESTAPQWQGVPITLTTGKALKDKFTEIRIHYTQENDEREANELTIRINPDESISFCIWTKKPGYDHTPELTPMNFVYAEHFDDLPDAYEKVFVDAMNSDHSLFTTSGEVLESWRILKPVQEHWHSQADIASYDKGVPYNMVS